MPIKADRSDIVWGYAGTALSMGSNLLLLPLMLYFLDGSYLGLWYVFASVGALSALFDFGFNPAIARNVAYVWSGAISLKKEGAHLVDTQRKAEVDYRLLGRLCKACRLLYLIIGFVALAIMGSAGTLYIVGIASGMDDRVVFGSWAVYVLAIFLNLYYGYFATLLRGVGAVAQYNKVLVFARCLQLVLTSTLLVAGCGLVAPVVGYFAYGFFLRLASKRAFNRYQDIGKRLSSLGVLGGCKDSLSLLATMGHNAWRDGLVALSNYLASQAIVIVSSLWLSLAETGMYSIAVQLLTAIATIASTPYSTAQPALSSAYVEGRSEYMREMFSVCMVAYALTFVICLALLLSLGIPLIFWIKPGTVLEGSVLLALGIYFYLYKRQQLYASCIANTNRLPYVRAYVISGLSSILLSIVLTGYLHMGVWGLIAGQALPQLAYNCWRWPRWVHKDFGFSTCEVVKLGSSGLLCSLKKMVGKGV